MAYHKTRSWGAVIDNSDLIWGGAHGDLRHCLVHLHGPSCRLHVKVGGLMVQGQWRAANCAIDLNAGVEGVHNLEGVFTSQKEMLLLARLYPSS